MFAESPRLALLSSAIRLVFGPLYLINALTRHVSLWSTPLAFSDSSQRAFWDGIGALEITIDMALIGIPVFVLWKVQTSWARKSAIVFAFAARAM